MPPPAVQNLQAAQQHAGGGGRETRQLAATTAPSIVLERVRLVRIPPGGRPAAGAPDFEAEARAMFEAPGSDLLIVTDGGFVMAPTGAPAVVWYCNASLEAESEALGMPWPRSPRRLRASWRAKAAIRKKFALARSKKVVVVANSKYTARSVARAIGRDACDRIVHPPVDTARFTALAARPKDDRVATVARFAPEKNLGEAVRIMAEVGGRYDIVGNARDRFYLDYRGEIGAAAASGHTRLHVNVDQDALEDVVGGARVYLQTSRETFGVAVVEAIAAGCVPVVPDNTAHPETVPFRELRYGTASEAAATVRRALAGEYDSLLPDLRGHARTFTGAAFQDAMMGIVCDVDAKGVAGCRAGR